jgi:hypothetical protein
MADKLPEWVKDLARAVPTDVVRDIVNDFRAYKPGPSGTSKVTVHGAGTVVTGDDGPAHRPYGQGGWVKPPQVDQWKPPGIEAMDRMMNQADLIDKAERVRKMIEARALIEAERKAREELQEKKGD